MDNETPGGENETAAENEAPESAATDGNEDYTPEQLADGDPAPSAAPADVNLDLVLDVPVEISLRVGSTQISIRDLVSLVEGSVVSLDQDAGEPMDVLVNGTMIARGEIVIVDDQYGVRLTDVVSPVERVEKLH